MPDTGWYIIIGGLAGMAMAVVLYREDAHG
jgi:hypothetical protein